MCRTARLSSRRQLTAVLECFRDAEARVCETLRLRDHMDPEVGSQSIQSYKQYQRSLGYTVRKLRSGPPSILPCTSQLLLVLRGECLDGELRDDDIGLRPPRVLPDPCTARLNLTPQSELCKWLWHVTAVCDIPWGATRYLHLGIHVETLRHESLAALETASLLANWTSSRATCSGSRAPSDFHTQKLGSAGRVL